MPVSTRSLGMLTASVIALAPLPASASIADVFTPGPHVDLALELDYRTRFLTSDGLVVNDVPADRIGRERLDDVRARVARAYLQGLGDALADEVMDSFPLFRQVEQRYRRYANVELLRDGPPPAPAPGAAGPAAPSPPAYALRFRLNARSERFDLAPGLELTSGAFRWRLAYRPLSDRLEMTASRPLMDRLSLDVTGGQSLDRGATDVRLGLALSF